MTNHQSYTVYCISLVIKQFFSLPKQSQCSRSILDGSRPLGLFWKSKTCNVAIFHRIDLVLCSHSRERKTPTYSQRNMVLP